MPSTADDLLSKGYAVSMGDQLTTTLKLSITTTIKYYYSCLLVSTGSILHSLTLVLPDDWLQDLISMARPFLADPAIIRKAQEGRVDEINTCIACNQVEGMW